MIYGCILEIFLIIVQVRAGISNFIDIRFYVLNRFQSEYRIHVNDSVGRTEHEIVMGLSFSLVKDNLTPSGFHFHESVHLIRKIGLIDRDLQYVRVHYRGERGNYQSLITGIIPVPFVIA